MIVGVIYIMINPVYPGYVKLGYTDNIKRRLKDLNVSSGTLLPFSVYAIYEVDKVLADKNLHKLIDKLNPNLREISMMYGKKRVKEFYKMSCEDAYDILY